MANGGSTNTWLIGVLIAVFLSLISYIWIDREGRLADLERRVEVREQAWHTARYNLLERLSHIEHQLQTLNKQVFQERSGRHAPEVQP